MGMEEEHLRIIAKQARGRCSHLEFAAREAAMRVDALESETAADVPTPRQVTPKIRARSAPKPVRLDVPLVSDVARRALRANFGSAQARREMVGFFASVHPLLQPAGIPVLRKVPRRGSQYDERRLGLTRDFARIELWSDGDRLCNTFWRVERLDKVSVPGSTYAQVERMFSAPHDERLKEAPLAFDLHMVDAEPERLAVAAKDAESFQALTDGLQALCDSKKQIPQYRVHIYADD